MIVLPFKNFRIGAAIQTPTSFSVTEFWRYSASSGFENPIYNCSCESPEGSYSYNIIAPFSANFGLAYAIPDVGFLSVDYEMTDYSLMRYAEKGAGRRYDDAFADANRAIKETMGLSHYLRAGLEVKLNPMFSARAGYNLITSAEKGDSGKRMAYSLGFGYSSPGSFFADMALRLTTMPGTTYGAYFNYDNYNKSGELVNVPSPVVNYTRKLWDVALTFGWRF